MKVLGEEELMKGWTRDPVLLRALAAAATAFAQTISDALEKPAAELERLLEEDQAPTVEPELTVAQPPPAEAVPEARRRRRGRRPVEVETRHCLHCGEAIKRRRYPNGRVDSPAAYRKRKYCSISCSNRSRRKPRPVKTPRAAKPEKAKAPAPKKERPDAWTSPELAILKDAYPREGPAGAREALIAAGHAPRTDAAIKAKAARLGLRKERRNLNHETVLELIRDYRGLPLAARDILDELGGHHMRLPSILADLLQQGLIAEKEDPFSGESKGRHALLFYDPHAEAEAA